MDLNIRFGFPAWLRPFVIDGVAGVTIGERIYLDPSVATLPEERFIAILRHEVIHVNQYARYGVVGFLVRYGAEYVRNRFRGLGRYAAYREISFEKEAFAEELREQIEDA